MPHSDDFNLLPRFNITHLCGRVVRATINGDLATGHQRILAYHDATNADRQLILLERRNRWLRLWQALKQCVSNGSVRPNLKSDKSQYGNRPCNQR